MISSTISRVSAGLLCLGGVIMLFAPDRVLPLLVPGIPRRAAILGQLLSAAWFGIATLNWLQRGSLLGGIYGRPIVLANFTLYFVTATALVRPVFVNASSWGLWLVFVPALIMTAVYWALMMRGPFDPLSAVAAN